MSYYHSKIKIIKAIKYQSWIVTLNTTSSNVKYMFLRAYMYVRARIFCIYIYIYMHPHIMCVCMCAYVCMSVHVEPACSLFYLTLVDIQFEHHIVYICYKQFLQVGVRLIDFCINLPGRWL